MHRSVIALQDLRYALRLLRRNPAFSLSAVATLALALGATIAVLMMAYGVLLRPLIVPDSARVLVASVADWQLPDRPAVVSFPQYRAWRDEATAFAHLSAIARTRFDLTGDGPAERVQAQVVSGNFFEMVAVSAQLGRTFDDSDARSAPCVIGHTLWQRRFGGDPDILGRTLRAGTLSFTIVGVMPPGFERWRGDTDLWVHIESVPSFLALHDRLGTHAYAVVGRLAPGATAAQAVQELSNSLRRFGADSTDRYGARAVPLRDDLVSRGTRRLLYFLCAMVLLVWTIACANVAGMLLARNSGRISEFAVRAALGASNRRLASQLALESLVLALVAGAAGLLIGSLLDQLLAAHAPGSMAQGGAVRMDWMAVVLTSALALCSALLISVLTVIPWPGGRLTVRLQESVPHATPSKRINRSQDLLVMAEIAIGIVVLVCTILVVRSLRNIDHVDLGFAPESVLTLNVRMPEEYASGRRKQVLLDTLRDRLAALGGVRHVSAGSLPVPNPGHRTSIAIEHGRRFLNGEARDLPFTPGLHFVGSDYFKTLGVPIVRGRDFSTQEIFTDAAVVVINERMARVHWPDQDPLGKRVNFGSRRRSGAYDEPWATVVGVVSDVRYGGPEGPLKPEIYLPLQDYRSEFVLFVKSDGSTTVHAEDLRRIIQAVDRNTPVFDVNTMEHYVRQATAEARYRSGLLSLFGLLANALTVSGLYGTVAGRVASRRRELAIRAVLGCHPRALIALPLGHAARLLLPAAAAGVALAAVSTRALASQLFHISTHDAASFASGTVLLLVMGFVAAYVPARRAARVDPATLLRSV